MNHPNWGTIQIASWKCNFSIYLDIQAITTLLCLLLVLYVLVPSIYSVLYLTTALLKSNVFRYSKVYSSHRHQTGFIVKRNQVRITNYLGLPINYYFFFLKLLILPPKKYVLFKNFPKIYCSFF